MDEWIKKMNGYIHNGVLFSHKEQNHIVFRKMDGTGDYHAE
jgi:hypothetical protein